MRFDEVTKKKKCRDNLNKENIRMNVLKPELMNRASFMPGVIEVLAMRVRNNSKRADNVQTQKKKENRG